MWIEWYCQRFATTSPFRRRAIDVKTLAMVAMGAGYQATKKASLPKHWRAVAAHTHVALEDAVEQGELFINIVRELNVQRGDVSLPAGPPPARTDRRKRRQHRGRCRFPE